MVDFPLFYRLPRPDASGISVGTPCPQPRISRVRGHLFLTILAKFVEDDSHDIRFLKSFGQLSSESMMWSPFFSWHLYFLYVYHKYNKNSKCDVKFGLTMRLSFKRWFKHILNHLNAIQAENRPFKHQWVDGHCGGCSRLGLENCFRL